MQPLFATPWRGLLLAAACILAGGAVLHALSLPALVGIVRGTTLAGEWARALQGLWLMFAMHLGVIAAFLVAAALRPGLASNGALLLCALLLAGDTGLLGGFMGLFPGTILVGVATALVIVARALRREGS